MTAGTCLHCRDPRTWDAAQRAAYERRLATADRENPAAASLMREWVRQRTEKPREAS